MQDTTIRKIIIFGWIVLAAVVLIFSDFGSYTIEIIYDCDLLDYYEAVPKDVVEECRKLKLEDEFHRNEQYFPRKNLTIT